MTTTRKTTTTTTRPPSTTRPGAAHTPVAAIGLAVAAAQMVTGCGTAVPRARGRRRPTGGDNLLLGLLDARADPVQPSGGGAALGADEFYKVTMTITNKTDQTQGIRLKFQSPTVETAKVTLMAQNPTIGKNNDDGTSAAAPLQVKASITNGLHSTATFTLTGNV